MQAMTIETEPDMSIMRKVVAASSAVTALAVGGTIALAVSGGYSPAVADSGATITASATNLAPLTAGTRLTDDRAVAIALSQAPGASVHEVELDTEHGVVVWKVELASGGTELEYRIDAATGAIVRAEVDGTDDAADHDASDDNGTEAVRDDHGGDDAGSDDHAGDDH